MTKLPAYYVTQTLLYSIPDRNRRTIWARDTEAVVKTFNADMKPWTDEMQAELEHELAELNSIGPQRA